MSSELQEKCINRILKENMELLNSKELRNRISYTLIKGDERVVSEMKSLSTLFKIVDRALLMNNYKKALRYSCLMRNRVNKLKKIIKKEV